MINKTLLIKKLINFKLISKFSKNKSNNYKIYKSLKNIILNNHNPKLFQLIHSFKILTNNGNKMMVLLLIKNSCMEKIFLFSKNKDKISKK